MRKCWYISFLVTFLSLAIFLIISFLSYPSSWYLLYCSSIVRNVFSLLSEFVFLPSISNTYSPLGAVTFSINSAIVPSKNSSCIFVSSLASTTFLLSIRSFKSFKVVSNLCGASYKYRFVLHFGFLLILHSYIFCLMVKNPKKEIVLCFVQKQLKQ